MKGNFAPCLATTLQFEGGWSDNKADPGGATMKGVTLETFRRLYPAATRDDLRAISTDDLQRIYEKDYWIPVRGDDLPAGVDLAVFDFGVNSGPSRAAKALQGALQVTQDGKIGNETVKASKAAAAADIVQRVCARRLSFLRGLKTFVTFGKGWTRRVTEIEARGVKMALVSGGMPATTVQVALTQEAKKADTVASRNNKVAIAGGSTAVGAGGSGIDLSTGDLNMWLIGAAVLAAVVVVTAIRSRSSIHQARAAAYREAAS